jgi:predicted metalloprotease with PDZ domain
VPYGVFLRYNPVNAGGGVGHYRSFVITYGAGAGSDVDKIRVTLSHEMFHTFQPFIDGGLTSSWFGEGLAVFYQARLPARFGLITPDAFLDDLNETAGRYYTSAMATLPNSAIPELFWKDTRARTLPYDRGMLYFATVDHAVREASGGKRSLDDLMLEMRARQNTKSALSNADWEAVVGAELGQAAVAAFRDFLHGKMPVPASAAFGPCFRATTRPMRQYELGFEPASLAEKRRVVRGLVPESAADRAGLRNGDLIVNPVPQDAIQGDQGATLRLVVERGGRQFEIEYLPRGATVQARQWERVSGIKDEACGL